MRDTVLHFEVTKKTKRADEILVIVCYDVQWLVNCIEAMIERVHSNVTGRFLSHFRPKQRDDKNGVVAP